MTVRWFSGPSPSAVARALQAAAPELSGLPVDLPDLAGRDHPDFQSSSAAPLCVERLMARHLRQNLGDALWRSEAGLPLPGHRTPAEWVADISVRFRSLGGQFTELSL
jgi:hypothetical protein